jgi:tRNA threonylcarbamoyladenosine modification (KEOPS) complex  Pcc1 subunit
MAATTYDILIEQGATFSQVITYKESGVAVNLTGYTARMQVRSTLESATTVVELTTANGRIALGGSAGTITLTIAAADTAGLTAGRGVYDLELVSGSGIVTRLLQGVATISRNVTR